MKRLLLLMLCGSIFFAIYYGKINGDFDKVEDLYNFPVPKSAQLIRETAHLKDYYWEASIGESIPLTYRLIVHKNGWQLVDDVEGLVYEKDGYFVSYSPATNYFAISDYTPYWEVDHAKK